LQVSAYDRDPWNREPLVLVDPPTGIRDVMKRVDRSWLRDRGPTLITLPRTSDVMQTVMHGKLKGVDVPLHRCLVIPMDHLEAKKRTRSLTKLKKAGYRVWRPRHHLRVVFVFDIGGINMVSTKLASCFFPDRVQVFRTRPVH